MQYATQVLYSLHIFRTKRRRHQPQPEHNCCRRTAAAAAAAVAAAAAAAAAVRRGWRWLWKLRRRRCGIATMVDKISSRYDIT